MSGLRDIFVDKLKMEKGKVFNFVSATHAQKQDNDFGLWFCKTIIEKEWFTGQNNRYSQRSKEFAALRSQMSGNVDITALKKEITGEDDDLSSLSLDYSFRHILPKSIKTVVDGFSDEIYKINIDAIDEIANKEKRKKQAEIRAKIMANDILVAKEQQLGYKLSYDNLPETEEELLLQKEIDNKLEREIAMEVSTSKIFNVNDMQETANKVAEDLALLGVGGTRNIMEPTMGVKIDYVTPENFIYSKASRGSRTGDGRYYFAELMRLPISEVKRLSNGEFEDKDYMNMTNRIGERTSYDRATSQNSSVDDENETAEVLHFCFRSDKKRVYKKRYTPDGKYKLEEKSETWMPEYNKHNRVEEVYETWYGGYWIMGSDYIFGYGELKDLIRPSSSIKKAIPPYSMYDLQTQSLGKRIMPHAWQLQIINIKTKQLITKAVPNGYAIDEDALQSFDMGNGMVMSPADQVKSFFRTGNIVFSGSKLDGTNVNRLPIIPLSAGISSDLQQLNNAYQFELQQIEDITGINKLRDGSTPGSEMAVGVQKLSIMMSNNATKHIFNGLLHILKDTAVGVMCRLQDLGQYDELGDGVANIIGHDNARILSKDKNKFYWMFSLTIEMRPTEEEKSDLMNDIRTALQAKLITLSDSIDIKAIDNIKLASQMLKAKEKAKLKREERIAQNQIRLKGEEDRRTAMTNAQAKAIERNAEMQLEANKINLDTQSKGVIMANDWKFKFKYQQQEFQNDYALKQLEISTIAQQKDQDDKEKMKRVKEQATATSKIAKQKQENGQPIDFRDENGEFNAQMLIQ